MFSFSEDMLPRHFPKIHLPKSKTLFEEAAVVVPQPTLPSVSLIFSNEVKEPQQSFQKWKDQHQAQTAKKRVRFAVNHCLFDRHNPTERKEYFEVQSKLESSFFEAKHQNDQPCQIKTEVTDPPMYEHKNHSPFEMNFRQYERAMKPNVMKENCLSLPLFFPSNNQHQSPSRMVKQLPSTNARLGHSMIDEQQRSSTEILLNILEEQQHHISIQQNHILMQEKQSLEQQKQICILECRIQQLMLQMEADDIQSHQSVDLYNNSKADENCTVEPINMGWRPSEDVIDKKNSTNCGIEKMILNVGLSSESTRESFSFNRTNGSINSAIFDYKIDAHSQNISVTAQASICDTSSANRNSHGNSRIAKDLSFMLNMLEMKYKFSEDDQVSLDTDERRWFYKQSNSQNDYQCSENNVPSDVHDYLVRHGLIKR